MKKSNAKYEQERRNIAVQLLGTQIDNSGAITADEPQMRAAFALADQILQFEDTEPAKTIVGKLKEHRGPPIEDTPDLREVLDWVLGQLHRYLHGSNKLDTWRNCKGGLCVNARDMVAKVIPDFVKEDKADESKGAKPPARC